MFYLRQDVVFHQKNNIFQHLLTFFNYIMLNFAVLKKLNILSLNEPFIQFIEHIFLFILKTKNY
jgi:hypothetical protein